MNDVPPEGPCPIDIFAGHSAPLTSNRAPPDVVKLSDTISTVSTMSGRLRRYNGVWTRDRDGKDMGKIDACILYWSERYEHEPTQLRDGPSGEAEMELRGHVYRAVLKSADRRQLQWSDG